MYILILILCIIFFLVLNFLSGGDSCFFWLCQYPMDKNKGVKVPVQLRVNMWLGLSANEKKFNAFAEGNFSVYAEMVVMAQSAVCICSAGMIDPP